MTNKQVRHLWWSQTRSWLVWLLVLIPVIGLMTAVQTTQLQRTLVVNMTATEVQQQRADFKKHPNDYKINGQRVSLTRYNVAQNQFFHKNQYQPHDYAGTPDKSGNWGYYLLALIGGLLFAFWGRRSHYYEFLLGLGARRRQIWRSQLAQGGALLAAVAVAQLIHWGWIITVIAPKYQQYRDLNGIIGNAVASVMASGAILALSWLIGQFIKQFWFAALLSFVIWRGTVEIFTDPATGDMLLHQQYLLETWWQAHYWLTSGLILLVMLGLLWLGARLFTTWTAEEQPASHQSGLARLLWFVSIVIGFGTMIGDNIIIEISNSSFSLTNQLWGMLLVLIVMLAWQLWWSQRRSREVAHG
ncbi:hypothetical protein [Lactiplantibacillus fabifermentans]|uniref:ABC transporter permease n=2 Tax=Lactiplantibacillus fabifermentans TaxID=483011 RepID=A0A0R2NND7_9LACO|nr:hypothetical protein [Lactiplantibacillus fabifermentans]ETY72851.1 hypothetical protein LFAB_15490 [Lactiplantibacillus fabifermentans T30PCM01]KRO26354.1 ABC transporter permease [Lactiplantibacillus fabifermentans DSM 21115]